MPAPITCTCMACPKCRTREWARERYRAKAYGQWSPHGDLEAVRAHLDYVRSQGVGRDTIAEAANVSRAHVGRIIGGQTTRIGKEVAARLLAVTPADTAKIEPYRVTRRLQALNAIGWTTREMADRLGWTQEAVWDHLAGIRKWVLRRTFDQADALYRELCMTPGGNTISVASAKRHGYAPPMAWDDIDDESEKPRGVGYVEPERARLLADLHAQGANATETCRALGISRSTLQKWCGNNGLSHIYRDLTGRESHTRNQYASEVA